MKRKRFSEEQIIGVLREHEAGTKASDLSRTHGVCEATIYSWKAKHGGMDINVLDEQELQDVVFTANLTPRKCLGYKTPFQAMLADLGKDVKIRFA